MGKGLAKRRRLTNALKAKSEKQGKTFIGGVAGKKRKQEIKDVNVPSSFRKMMALKAAAEGQSNKRLKLQEQRAGGAAQTAKPSGKQPLSTTGAPSKQDDSQPADVQHTAQQADGSGDGIPQPIQQRQPGPQEPTQQQQQQQQRGPPRRQQQQPDQDGMFKKKALRADKKEYLKLKKLKKQGKLCKDDGLVDKEREMLLKEGASRPLFGEQAAQPIKVNLKRHHWAADQDRTASQRCEEVFKKQMASATQRAAAAAVLPEPAPPRQQLQGGPPKTGKKGAKGHAKKKGKQAPGAGVGAGVSDETRLQLIEAYRDAKRQKMEAAGRGMGTSATPQSLAELVRRDAGKAAAFQAQHA